MKLEFLVELALEARGPEYIQEAMNECHEPASLESDSEAALKGEG
jgi:hypothetical protein